jgi:hypothetical protein
MMACDSCPFTTDDHTAAVCPQCKRAIVYEPTPQEIAQATAKIRAGWSRRKQMLRLAHPEQPVEVTRAIEW